VLKVKRSGGFSPGYVNRLVLVDADAAAPEFLFCWGSAHPDRPTLQVLTPFSIEAKFRLRRRVDSVVVRDRDGRHVVAVGNAASTRPSLTPEAAKQAVIELIRTHPNLFIGKPDPDRLAGLPLIDRGDGSYGFGVVVVNPARGWYSATVGPDAPEVYEYTGKFELIGNAWVATEPQVTRFHQAR
jgi:hypothetical protein